MYMRVINHMCICKYVYTFALAHIFGGKRDLTRYVRSLEWLVEAVLTYCVCLNVYTYMVHGNYLEWCFPDTRWFPLLPFDNSHVFSSGLTGEQLQCLRAACCLKNFDLQSRWPVPRVLLPFTHVCIHVKSHIFLAGLHVNAGKLLEKWCPNLKKTDTANGWYSHIEDILQIMDDSKFQIGSV